MAGPILAQVVVGFSFLQWDKARCQNRRVFLKFSRRSFYNLRPQSPVIGFADFRWSSRVGWSSHQQVWRTAADMLGTSRCQLEDAVAVSASAPPHEIDKFVRQEPNVGIEEKSPGNGPGFESSGLYYDELLEATATLKKKSQASDFWNTFRLKQPEGEGVKEFEELTGDGEPSDSDGEPEGPELNVNEDLGKRKPRLVLESNGPPLASLQAYLAPDVEGAPTQKLPRLPLPIPHKMRPWGLPKPSLRTRLGIIPVGKLLPNVDLGDVMNDLVDEIRALQDGVNVTRVLSKYASRLKRGSLARVIGELGEMQYSKRALEVLLWMRQRRHLWPDYTSLCTAIKVLVEAGDVETASDLQKTEGRDSPKAAQTLATSLANAGKFIEAVEVLNRMKVLGWKIDGSVHTKLIQSACRVGAKDIAEGLLKNTNVLELNLTSKHYRSIIASCSKLDLHDTAERVFLHSKASGLQPNIGIYTARISALIRQGKDRVAVDLIHELKKTGCIPDLVAYQVMFQACGNLGDLETANMLFEDIAALGLDATPDIYNTLIQLLHRFGHTQKVTDLIEEMTNRGFAPSAQTSLSMSSPAITFSAD